MAERFIDLREFMKKILKVSLPPKYLCFPDEDHRYVITEFSLRNNTVSWEVDRGGDFPNTGTVTLSYWAVVEILPPEKGLGISALTYGVRIK